MITDVLGRVREHYLQRYVASLNEFRAAHNPAAPEILVELTREGPLAYKLYRVDMGSNSNGTFNTQEVNPASHLSFEPIHEQLNNLGISLSPVAWNGVELTAQLRTFDPKPLEEWTLKWLDVDDHYAQDDNGLQGVIHSVTEPRFEKGILHFAVDFGSAPIASFNELLLILERLGATKAEVASSCI